MLRQLLISKSHRATATHCKLHCEGFYVIDENLLDVGTPSAVRQAYAVKDGLDRPIG